MIGQDNITIHIYTVAIQTLLNTVQHNIIQQQQTIIDINELAFNNNINNNMNININIIMII